MNKILDILRFYLIDIDLFEFIWLNYFSRHVIRLDGSKIIPYKHVVFEFEKNSKIQICNGAVEIGCDRLRRSRMETLIRLRDNAKWESNGGCHISYGCTVEVLSSATLSTQYYTMNSNCVIVCSNAITIGNDVMVGRNVIIYDSNFHDIYDEFNIKKEKSKRVTIGNHVWLTTNAMVLKGADIGDNTIVGTGNIIKNNLDSNSMILADDTIIRISKWTR